MFDVVGVYVVYVVEFVVYLQCTFLHLVATLAAIIRPSLVSLILFVRFLSLG